MSCEQDYEVEDGIIESVECMFDGKDQKCDRKKSVIKTKVKLNEYVRRSEQAFENFISYVPSYPQRCALYEKSKHAIVTVDGQDEAVITKNNTDLNKDTVNKMFGERSIFSKNGRFNKMRFKTLSKPKNGFTLSYDRNPPMKLDTASMGPNIVLETGEPRVNLFHKDENTTFELLEKFMQTRKENANTIICAIIKEMKDKNVGIDRFTSYLFEMIEEKNTGFDFVASGLGLVSFCQTWDPATLRPNFSVPSPHFQTKLVVTDPTKFRNAVRSMTTDNKKEDDSVCEGLKNYAERNANLLEAFGKAGYRKKFVCLDDLYEHLKLSRT